MVDVLVFDIGDNQPPQMEALEGAKCFIRLENQQIVISRVSVGPNVDQVPTDHEGRIFAQLTQDGYEHGSCGGLPMGSGDANAGLLCGDGFEQLGSSPYRYPGVAGRFQLFVIIGNRRGSDNECGVIDRLRVVTHIGFDIEISESLQRRSRFQVGAGELVSPSQQQLGDGTHTCSTGADQVYPALGEAHPAASIIAVAMVRAACGLAISAVAAAIFDLVDGSAISSEMMTASRSRSSSGTTTEAPALCNARALPR
jgi:hypothetical protein